MGAFSIAKLLLRLSYKNIKMEHFQGPSSTDTKYQRTNSSINTKELIPVASVVSHAVLSAVLLNAIRLIIRTALCKAYLRLDGPKPSTTAR